MNTKNSKAEQKNQRRETGQKQGTKKQGQKSNALRNNVQFHEQERIETRMTD
jgi:hypothetical protein